MCHHTRKDVGQHLFAINGVITVVDIEEFGNDIYKSVNTTEMYAVVPFETIELGEEVDVCVQASSTSEAEAIGITMLEGGELQCDGVICIQCSAVFA